MNFADWTRDELEAELGRLDAMQGARSTATMMRRNEVWLEIERRPRQRKPISMAPVLAMRADIAARKAANR